MGRSTEVSSARCIW